MDNDELAAGYSNVGAWLWVVAVAFLAGLVMIGGLLAGLYWLVTMALQAG